MNNNILEKLIRHAHGTENREKFKHFSYLLDGKKVVGVGLNNMRKTHPIAAKYNAEYPFVHSELAALIDSDYSIKDLRKCSLVNIRLGKRGGLLLSRPCNSCARILADFQIGEVLYSNQFGNFEQMVY